MKFSDLFVETHYTDMYGKSFFDFKKQYNKRKNENLYINFSDHSGDPLDRSIKEDPDHSDPAGIYAYPIKYVLDYPADIWYGRNSKYLRVIKPKQLKTLDLQYAFNDIGSVHYYLKKCGVHQSSYYIEFIRKVFELKNNPSDYAKLFFKFIQINFDDIGESINKKNRYDISYDNRRPSIEQTELLRNAGYHIIVDSARSPAKAVINDREPEQAIFLTPQSFEIIDVFQIGGRFFRDGKRIPAESKISGHISIADIRKMAQTIAREVFDDKLLEDIDNKKFWTVGGRQIEITEFISDEYIRTHKLGEKKHRESKQYSQQYIHIEIECEYGVFTFDSSIDDDIYDIINIINLKLSGKPLLKRYEKKTKEKYLKNEKERIEASWAKQSKEAHTKKYETLNRRLSLMNEFFKKYTGKSLNIKIKNDSDYIYAFEYSIALILHNTKFDSPMNINHDAIARHININSDFEDDRLFIVGEPYVFVSDNSDTLEYIRNTTEEISDRFNEIFKKYPEIQLEDTNPNYLKYIDVFINDIDHKIRMLTEDNQNEQ